LPPDGDVAVRSGVSFDRAQTGIAIGRHLNIAAGFLFCADHALADESAAKVCAAFVRGLTHVMDLRLPPFVRTQVLVSGLEAAKQLTDTGLVVLHAGNLGRVYKGLEELDLSVARGHMAE
jgi:hypothetical protein